MEYTNSRIVMYYAIFAEGRHKYCYVGSSICPEARLKRHMLDIANGCHCGTFMSRVLSKHGISNFVVFRRQTGEHERLTTEQAYYDFFAKRGYCMMNAVTPIRSACANYSFAALDEYKTTVSRASKLSHNTPEFKTKISKAMRVAMSAPGMHDKLSAAIKRGMSKPGVSDKIRRGLARTNARPEVHERRSKASSKILREHNPMFNEAVHERWLAKMQSIEVRQHISDGTKRGLAKPGVRERQRANTTAALQRTDVKQRHLDAMHRPELRQHLSELAKAQFANDDFRHMFSERVKAAMSRPDTHAKFVAGIRDRDARHAAFVQAYGTWKVFRYAQTVGRFEPWMHFIIVDGTVTVFVWDTRKVLFQCQETELPEGYVRAKDILTLLQDTF